MTQRPQPEAVQANMDWFVQARFGMFIHWGYIPLPRAMNG